MDWSLLRQANIAKFTAVQQDNNNENTNISQNDNNSDNEQARLVLESCIPMLINCDFDSHAFLVGLFHKKHLLPILIYAHIPMVVCTRSICGLLM